MSVETSLPEPVSRISERRTCPGIRWRSVLERTPYFTTVRIGRDLASRRRRATSLARRVEHSWCVGGRTVQLGAA